MKTGRDLVQLATELQRQAEASKDFIADTRELAFQSNETGSAFSIPINSHRENYLLTDIAHNQVAERLGIPKKYYDRLRTESPDLLDTNVNHWLQSNPERRLIRTLDNKTRAVLSDRYRPLDHVEVFETALPALIEAEAVIQSCEVTDRRLYLKATTPRITAEIRKGDIVQAGIVIGNSEVGLGSLNAQLFIFTLACLNGMTTSSEYGLRQQHTGKRMDISDTVAGFLKDDTRMAEDRAFFLKLRDVIQGFFVEENFQAIVKKLRDATEHKIEGDPIKAVEVVQKQFQLTDPEKNSVIKHLLQSGDYTRYGLLNAVTRTSQELEDYDRATEFESLGGKVLELPKRDWQLISQAAA